jgi:hypothetical protein
MLSERYPFLTICRYAGIEYIGIVQNKDDSVTTIYDYGSVIDPDLKKLFLELASTWWWESNRSIPINIFLKSEWEIFRPCLRTFSNKDFDIIYGPACSLNDIAKKKSKRKSITLVRRLD